MKDIQPNPEIGRTIAHLLLLSQDHEEIEVDIASELKEIVEKHNEATGDGRVCPKTILHLCERRHNPGNVLKAIGMMAANSIYTVRTQKKEIDMMTGGGEAAAVCEPIFRAFCFYLNLEMQQHGVFNSNHISN